MSLVSLLKDMGSRQDVVEGSTSGTARGLHLEGLGLFLNERDLGVCSFLDSFIEYVKDGLKHVRVKFYIQGSEPGKQGTVHAEVKEVRRGGDLV